MIPDNQNDVLDYEENYGVIIFLDALGMKGVWKNKDPKTILKKWNSFVSKSKDIIDIGKKFNVEISMYAFSDTVIISVKKGEIYDLLTKAGTLAGSLLETNILRELYFRGAISVGRIFEHKERTIVLGPAVDEAATYYSLPNMVGVYLAPSAHSVIERLYEERKPVTDYAFMKYDIPFKDRSYNNAWIVKMDLVITEKHKEKIENPDFIKFNNLKEIAHYNLEHLDNVEAAEKWKNTLEYMYTISKNGK